MRAMVTGSEGFIGSRLVERLAADGNEVIGVDKKPYRDWFGRAAKHVPRLREDVATLDRSEWNSLAVDVVFHLAAESRIQPSFDAPVKFVWSNTLGTAAVLDWATRHEAKVVYAGSSTADDDVTKNVYALTKRHGEELCLTFNHCFGTRVSIARFYNVYGPGQIEEGPYETVIGVFERQFRNGEKLTVTGDGGQRRDFTHVDDIVDGLIRMGEQELVGCPIFSFGSGTNYSILEVARMFVGDERIEFVPKRPGESDVTLANCELAERRLGWRPKASNLPSYVSSIVNGHA